MTDSGKTVRRYRSRPVVVEAMQWTERNATAIRSWMDQRAHQSGFDWYSKGPAPASLWVKKSQRWCLLDKGDYVVREPDGDGFYPCKRDIFEDRYDLVAGAHSGSSVADRSGTSEDP